MGSQDAARAAMRLLVDRDEYDGPIAPVLHRMIVPGWPQFYRRQRLRGCCFLGLYVALAALALASLGTEMGSIFLGLALATHASSVLDVVLPATRESESRLLRVLATLGLVGVIAYVVPFYAVRGLAIPRRITATAGPLKADDIVLVSFGIYRLRSPQPGDAVLYELPKLRLLGRSGARRAAFELQGERIDRILAGPGERLQFKDRSLFVDGQPSSQLPLDAEKMPKELDVEVPQGCYFILPTTAMEGMELDDGEWGRAGLVPADRIVGRVWGRHWPWRRFTWF